MVLFIDGLRHGFDEIVGAIIGTALIGGIAVVLFVAAKRSTDDPESYLAFGTAALFTLGGISVFLAVLFWVPAFVAGIGWILAQREGGVSLLRRGGVALAAVLGVAALAIVYSVVG